MPSPAPPGPKRGKDIGCPHGSRRASRRRPLPRFRHTCRSGEASRCRHVGHGAVRLAQLPACSTKLRLNFQRRCPEMPRYPTGISCPWRFWCLPRAGSIAGRSTPALAAPNCQSVDSGFSSPHVRFEPTCIICPCRGVERQWWLGGRGSPRAAKRCTRCPVRAALSERPPSPRTTPRFDDALDVCMLHCLPSLLLSLCRYRKEGQKGNGAFACSFPPRNGS